MHALDRVDAITAMPQIQLLRFTGFLPFDSGQNQPALGKWRRISPVYSAYFAGSLLVGACLSSIYQAVFALFTLFTGDYLKSDYHPALLALQLMSYFLVNFRAFLVLFLLLLTQNKWRQLSKIFHCFISNCFPTGQLQQDLLCHVRRISWLLVAVTLVLHLTAETADWISFFHEGPNVTEMTSLVWSPLPYRVFEYLIVWILFSAVPFFLSQQLFATAIIMAVTFGKFLDNIHREIADLTKEYLQEGSLSIVQSSATIARTNLWKKQHMQALFFCQTFNSYFGVMLLVIHGGDLGFVLGQVSDLVTVKDKSHDYYSTCGYYAYLVCVSTIFLLYQTVFLLPLIRANEKAAELSVKLHQLDFAIEGKIGQISDWDPRHIRELEQSCIKYPRTLNASELIQYSTGYIISTCALIVSFAVVVSGMMFFREFFDNDHHITSHVG